VNDPQIRAALERHWTASAAGDQDAEHEIYNDDAVVEYPQSGERVRGRHNVQALRSQHPARPSGFVVRRIVGGVISGSPSMRSPMTGVASTP
jgi:hypothetical protein